MDSGMILLVISFIPKVVLQKTLDIFNYLNYITYSSQFTIIPSCHFTLLS